MNVILIRYIKSHHLSVTHWNNAAIYLLLQDKLLWQWLLHFSCALKHIRFKLLHY